MASRPCHFPVVLIIIALLAQHPSIVYAGNPVEEESMEFSSEGASENFQQCSIETNLIDIPYFVLIMTVLVQWLRVCFQLLAALFPIIMSLRDIDSVITRNVQTYIRGRMGRIALAFVIVAWIAVFGRLIFDG